MFKKAIFMIDQGRHCAIDMSNLPHEIAIMIIINGGQKCTVSYSHRMCDSNSPQKNMAYYKMTPIKSDVLEITFLLFSSY